MAADILIVDDEADICELVAGICGTCETPVLATEFCGTSVTSNSRPQARTEEYLAMNPHIAYGRSDRRGFAVMDLAPEHATVLFQGLENVKSASSAVATLARFRVEDGRPGVLPVA